MSPSRRSAHIILFILAVAGSFVAWHAITTPASAGVPPLKYVVQPGDTVWSIASAQSGVGDPRPEMLSILQTNHLDAGSPGLRPGQVLLVPRR